MSLKWPISKRLVIILRIHNQAVIRASGSRAPSAVFIEKCIEEPVVVVAENDGVDMIGPPDKLSNLRPIIRSRLMNETVLQQKLRQVQDATQQWNQEFWALHNTKFVQEKQNYIAKHQEEGNGTRTLTADEMSEFYKDFLDTNWETHVRYNFEWYKRNFTLLVLALGVQVEKCFAKFR